MLSVYSLEYIYLNSYYSTHYKLELKFFFLLYRGTPMFIHVLIMNFCE